MSADEFSIIEQYFDITPVGGDVHLGIGDDAALLNPPADKLLVMTMDTLISGVHFPDNTSPEDIAYKSIAVNLSDLAAMGATPGWLMLSIALPEADEIWLQKFSSSFRQTCDRFEVQLIGGDTTRGALSITVQATGSVDEALTMRRDAAKVGDRVLITGSLGDAAMALQDIQSGVKADEYCLNRLNRPTPRVGFAAEVAQYSRCAIDISDGLLADLGHITSASQCGAEIQLQDVPLSTEVRARLATTGDEYLADSVFVGGDDYELCLAVSPDHIDDAIAVADRHELALTDVGVITQGDDVSCYRGSEQVTFEQTGYKHYG